MPSRNLKPKFKGKKMASHTDHVVYDTAHQTMHCTACKVQQPLRLPQPISDAVRDMNDFSKRHEQCPNYYPPTQGKLYD